jgi:Tol biopolymer transport system component
MKAFKLCIFCILTFGFTAANEYPAYPNEYIYFSSEKNSRGRDIVRMDSDGGNRIKLTSHNGSGHYPHYNGPKISPDGSKLAYHADTDGHDKYAIWTMNIDGSNATRITQREGLFAYWSPDGGTIIFSGRRNGIWEILTVPSRGGKELNLTKNYKKLNKPSWGAHCSYHPDGKSIVYSYIREKVLYSMDLETNEIIQISPPNESYVQPAYSEDGKFIALNRKIKDGYDLITMSTTGESIRVIVENVVSYSTPSWSFSGKELLFTGMVNGSQEIFRINLKSKIETQLTKNSEFDAMPTW